MKKLFGLTGKTGSGKSTAAAIFAKKGAYIIDCDSIAHEVLEYNNIRKKIRKAFTDSVFDGEKVDRKALGKVVFTDKDKLRLLNSIVHPTVTERIMELARSCENDIVVIDGSELESSGIDEKLDRIIVVDADEDVRAARIMARDGIDIESAMLRIKAQKSYSKRADIIMNNGDKAELEKKIENLLLI